MQNGGLNLPHTLKLILNGRTVAALVRIAPGNNGSIGQNGCESTTCGLDLLYILEMPLNSKAISLQS